MTTQRMLPLYESKMIHQYDHRWATYGEDGATREVAPHEKATPAFVPRPRYWVREDLLRDRLGVRWDRSWIAAWRGIARTTDVRTAIASALPAHPGGGNFDLLLPTAAPDACVVLACMNSFCHDYVVRQKLTNMHLQFSVVRQLPVIAKKTSLPWADRQVDGWISERVLELSYASNDLRPLAEDMGDDGEPFVWDPERRFWLRAELDAAFFHLYGVERDDVDYIMETFPIVKRKDLAAHGSFRTKEAIVSIYDAMAEAIASGTEYETVLSPPPGDGARHPAQEQAS